MTQPIKPRKNRKRRRQSMTPIKQYSFLSIRDRREYLEMNIAIRRRERLGRLALIATPSSAFAMMWLKAPGWSFLIVGSIAFFAIWYAFSTLEDLKVNRSLFQSRLQLPSDHAKTFQKLSFIEPRDLLDRDVQRLDPSKSNAQQPLI